MPNIVVVRDNNTGQLFEKFEIAGREMVARDARYEIVDRAVPGVTRPPFENLAEKHLIPPTRRKQASPDYRSS